jgi:hypothetical protein
MYWGDELPPANPTAYDDVKEWLGFGPPPPQKRHPLPLNDPALIPVLAELLKDKDVNVRVQAAATLWWVASEAKGFRPHVLEALGDKEGNVSYWAAEILKKMDATATAQGEQR